MQLLHKVRVILAGISFDEFEFVPDSIEYGVSGLRVGILQHNIDIDSFALLLFRAVEDRFNLAALTGLDHFTLGPFQCCALAGGYNIDLDRSVAGVLKMKDMLALLATPYSTKVDELRVKRQLDLRRWGIL